MEALTIIVQWCHVVAGMLWVGGAALLEFVVRPVLERQPAETERSVGGRLSRMLVPYFAVAGSATIVFGVLRGTLFGPIKSVAALTSPYGITWCTALLIAAALAVLGAVGVGRGSVRYYQAAASQDEASLIRGRLILYGRLQLGGFALILVCMLLMSELFS